MLSVLQDYESAGLLKNGKPRLLAARSYFLDMRQGDLQGLVSYYEAWRDFTEYLVLQKQTVSPDPEKETIAVKCSKRGNDVYQRRVKARLAWMDQLPEARFFTDEEIPQGTATTKMAFFTLTYDTKRCSQTEAWENVGSEYNGWISRLRYLDPKLSVIRVWQSFGNGYPHIHGVILFQDLTLHVQFKQEELGPDGQADTVYRIAEKEIFESSWHSWVDVAACYSVRGALHYCKRYITRQALRGESYSLPPQKGGSLSSQDQAMMWVYRKRSFSVSGDFRSRLHDLIRDLHNSKIVSGQLTLEGDYQGLIWECLGVHSAAELGVDGSRWFHRLTPDQVDPEWIAAAARRDQRIWERAHGHV